MAYTNFQCETPKHRDIQYRIVDCWEDSSRDRLDIFSAATSHLYVALKSNIVFRKPQ